MTAVSSTVDTGRQPRERQALLLAELLRSSRLTLLCGAPRSGKSSLLRTGVLPLLRRRAEDRRPRVPSGQPASDPARVVIPFPDRRQRAGAAQRNGEIVLLFDDWRSDPLPRLRHQLQEALGPAASADARRAPATLGELIASAARVHGARTLILLDGFEQHLEVPPLRTDVQRFDDQLVQAVSDEALPAHFLISMRVEARPLLERFRGRLPGLDRNWLNLPPRPGADGGRAVGAIEIVPRRATLVAVPSGSAVAALAAGASGPALEPAVPVAALAEPQPAAAPTAELSGAVSSPAPPAVAPTPPAVLPAEPLALLPAPTAHPPADESLRPAPAALPAAPAALQPAPTALPPAPTALPPAPSIPAGGAPSRRPGWLLWSALALGVAAALWAWRSTPTPGTPPTALPLPVAAAPGPPSSVAAAPRGPVAEAAPPALPPAWPVQTGPAQRTDARIATELARYLPASLVGPPLQIVHYDALQAARQDRDTALRIVAPLFPEELHLVVRADSPLAYIHQIRGHSIDVGPAVAGRPSTAAVLYERLFGQPLPPALTRSSDWPEALASLSAGRTDVAVLVDAQPSAWLAEMPPAARAGFKLLALDPSAPESRRALQGFLQATLREPFGTDPALSAATGTPSLAVMSFLVADETAPAFDTAPKPAAAAARAADGAAAGDPLTQLARSLCSALPALRRDGHPKWQQTQPSLYLPVGWPYAEGAHQALKDCAAAQPGSATAAPPGSSPLKTSITSSTTSSTTPPPASPVRQPAAPPATGDPR